MERFSGWMRGTAIAALMVLSTAACAQRVTAPEARPTPPPPVAEAPAPKPAPAPAPQAPAAQTADAAKPAPEPEPAPKVAETPAPPPAAPTSPAPTPPKTAETPTDPAAPTVASAPPKEPGGQYRVTEQASTDYGSTVASNPTPDSALDIAAVSESDAPPAPPAIVNPAPQPPATPAVPSETFAALASLFGTDTPEPEPEPAPVAVAVADAAPAPLLPIEPVAEEQPLPAVDSPLAANTIDPAGEETGAANPYPGGFDDENAYETAQLYTQPSYGFTPQPAPAPAFNPNAPVTVAILTPDSDSRASIRSLAKGLAQAAALSARTLGNRQLTLRGYDTGGTPEKAQIAARQAIADGARLIIGPLFSSSANAVAPVAQSAGVPVIAFTTDQSVLRRGIYSVGYLPDAEVERMLSYAAQRGINKIGLLSPDTPYGGIVYNTVRNAAPQYGINVATVQAISPNFAQAAETGQRFADFYKAAPDTRGVMIATNGKPLQAIAAYLAYNDVLPSEVQFMGLGTWDDPETFREATLRGGWFPGLDPALKAEFESRYSNAYGSKPPPIAALAYDGIAIAGALLQRAQATRQNPFTPTTIETPSGFRGMSGLFRFLPDGRNQRLLSILKVGRRQFELLDPAPASFGQRLTSVSGYAQ